MLDKMIDTNLNKRETVAFSGHRHIPFGEMPGLEMDLAAEVSMLYSLGFRNFLCGMAMGFDMMAAKVVISLRKEMPGLRLIAVVPFARQSERWSERAQMFYHYLLTEADDIVQLSDTYYQGCLLRRNDYMLEHSSRVVAYFDGKPKGGTYYTCRKASEKGMQIINLFNH